MRDGGGKWNNVTAKNITGLPVWGTVKQIAASPFDPGTAYVAFDFHMMDDRQPYLYKTTDYGQTWKKISDGLPQKHPLAYVLSVAENPNRRGMIFAGTGNAFYYSMDDGGHWQQFKDGLPPAPVSWITLDKPSHDVVVSTYGRGIYILHDITPLEQADKVAAGADVVLFEPPAGVRQARAGHVDLVFNLKAAPKDSVKIEIMDAKGAVVRTMRQAGRAGSNLAVWDLRGKSTSVRVDPVRARRRRRRPAHLGRAALQGGRPCARSLIGESRIRFREGRSVLDGKYSARVTADGGTSATQPFSVLRDPEIATSEASISKRMVPRKAADEGPRRHGLRRVYHQQDRADAALRQIEDRVRGDTARAELRTALGGLDKKLLDIELVLLSKSDFYSDDKYYVEPFHVYSSWNLIWLSGEIAKSAPGAGRRRRRRRVPADRCVTEGAAARVGGGSKRISTAHRSSSRRSTTKISRRSTSCWRRRVRWCRELMASGQ